jgi:hypothetical protein
MLDPNTGPFLGVFAPAREPARRQAGSDLDCRYEGLTSVLLLRSDGELIHYSRVTNRGWRNA